VDDIAAMVSFIQEERSILTDVSVAIITPHSRSRQTHGKFIQSLGSKSGGVS
jgi:hypothetical protein